MAILGFKKQFAGKVRNGRKRQTIRAFRKYPIKQGETLYLYTALRTKNAEKLREVKCKSVHAIEIWFNRGLILYTDTDTYYSDILKKHVLIKRGFSGIKTLNAFARCDGFKNWDDMKAFWIAEHGVKKANRKLILLKFEGILIKW